MLEPKSHRFAANVIPSEAQNWTNNQKSAKNLLQSSRHTPCAATALGIENVLRCLERTISNHRDGTRSVPATYKRRIRGGQRHAQARSRAARGGIVSQRKLFATSDRPADWRKPRDDRRHRQRAALRRVAPARAASRSRRPLQTMWRKSRHALPNLRGPPLSATTPGRPPLVGLSCSSHSPASPSSSGLTVSLTAGSGCNDCPGNRTGKRSFPVAVWGWPKRGLRRLSAPAYHTPPVRILFATDTGPAMSHLDALQLVVAVAFFATWAFVGGVMIRHS